MIDCPNCHRALPEIAGAAQQSCPHCGHEFGVFLGGDAPLLKVDPTSAASAAFRIFARRYPSLLLLWLPVLVVDIAVTTASQAFADSLGPALGAGDLATGLRYLGFALPLSLAFLATQIAFSVLVAAHVHDQLALGGGTETLRRALRMPLAMLGLGLLLMLAAVGGVVLVFVGTIVFLHWFQFAPAALADRRAGVVDALQASRRFAKERRTFGFTALVLFIALAIYVAWLALSTATVLGLAAVGVEWWGTRILVGALLWWLLTPLLPVLPAAYWAIAKRAPTPDASAPTGLAAERFRTTKCPQCATLVPYQATGGAVNVTCPVCGRQGKVI